MSGARKQLGLKGERLAERFLRSRGLATVARQYETPVGELDLVMRQGDTIVFVEVKTRSNRGLADPHEAVNREKQRRMTNAARWMVQRKRWHDRPLRFDVVGVVIPVTGDPEIEHYPDAFLPTRWD